MSFWNDLTEKVNEGSKIVADKAKKVSEIANIKAQIISCDNVINKNYKELGKAFFEAHKDDIDPEYADIVKVIKESMDKKDALNEKLASCKDGAPDIVDDIADGAEEVVNEVKETASEVVDAVKDAVNNDL